MALIVEDGTIVAGAESYASVAFSDSYHDSRMNTDWALLDTEAKEQSLRLATDYMTGKFGLRWDGYLKDEAQPLNWPRIYVHRRGTAYTSYISDSIVPVQVQNACASLALRASSETLLADEERAIKFEKVDVIETEYESHSSPTKKYSEIEAMLSIYLITGRGTLQMVRV